MDLKGLRSFVTRILTVAFVTLLGLDWLDDLAFGNRWAGMPREMFALMGAILAGLFTAEALGRSRDGKGNGVPGKEG